MEELKEAGQGERLFASREVVSLQPCPPPPSLPASTLPFPHLCEKEG